MKLLVIGTGLAGRNLVKEGLDRGMEVVGTFYNQEKDLDIKQHELDKSDRESTIKLLKEGDPDLVVDTGAMHDVDGCEENPEKSKRINVEGTRNVADVCKKIKAKLVFISTDYVFSGKSSKLYTEGDEPDPLSVYGKHKLEGEKVVLETLQNPIVARPSVIYGWDPVKVNFVTWALGELESGNEISIVNDQYSRPTLANDLANALMDLAERHVNGIFHVAGETCLNRYEFTLKLADVFDFDRSLIEPITTEEFGQEAPRPKKGCISIEKVEEVLGREMLTAEEGLQKMKATQ